MIMINEDKKMNFYIAKPFQAIQVLPENIDKVINILPESFVFFGINMEGRTEQKEYDDDLKKYKKIGGFFYHNKKTEKIYHSDWVIIRKEKFEIVKNDYFEANFVEIPFIQK